MTRLSPPISAFIRSYRTTARRKGIGDKDAPHAAIIYRYDNRIRKDARLSVGCATRIDDRHKHLDETADFWPSLELAAVSYCATNMQSYLHLKQFECRTVQFRAVLTKNRKPAPAAPRRERAARIARSLNVVDDVKRNLLSVSGQQDGICHAC